MSMSTSVDPAFAATEHGALALTAAGAASGAGLGGGRAAPSELTGAIRESVARRAGMLATLSGSLVGQRKKGRVVNAALVAQAAALRAAADAAGRGGKEAEDEEALAATVELLPAPELRYAVERVIADGASLGASALALSLRDLLVLAFEVGDVREGRGERLLMSQMLLEIGRSCPGTVRAALRLVPEFASWRNLRQLHDIAVRTARAVTLDRDDAGEEGIAGGTGGAAAVAAAGRVDAAAARARYEAPTLVGLAEAAEEVIVQGLRRDVRRLARWLRRKGVREADGDAPPSAAGSTQAAVVAARTAAAKGLVGAGEKVADMAQRDAERVVAEAGRASDLTEERRRFAGMTRRQAGRFLKAATAAVGDAAVSEPGAGAAAGGGGVSGENKEEEEEEEEAAAMASPTDNKRKATAGKSSEADAPKARAKSKLGVSLAGKWAPSQGSASDRASELALALALRLFPVGREDLQLAGAAIEARGTEAEAAAVVRAPGGGAVERLSVAAPQAAGSSLADALAVAGVRAAGAAPAVLLPESLRRRAAALRRKAEKADAAAERETRAGAERVALNLGLEADAANMFRAQAKARARREHARAAGVLRARARRLEDLAGVSAGRREAPRAAVGGGAAAAGAGEGGGLAARLEGHLRAALMRYRWLLTGLRAASGVVESLMAQQRWEDIDVTSIPSAALAKYQAGALRNSKRDVGPGYSRKPSEDPARRVLRHRLLLAAADTRAEAGSRAARDRVKGRALPPHEITGHYLRKAFLDPEVEAMLRAEGMALDPRREDAVLEAQWADLVASCREAAAKREAELARGGGAGRGGGASAASGTGAPPAGAAMDNDTALAAKLAQSRELLGAGAGLSSALAVVDVSGSMGARDEGRPLHASMALGLLASELCDPDSPWHGRLLTFDGKPKWMHFPATVPPGSPAGAAPRLPSVCDRVTALEQAHTGGGTDVAAALEAVLERAVAAEMPASQLPRVLLVLSDMEVEEARGWLAPRIAEAAAADREAGGEGLLLRATREAFRQAGYDRMPRVVFWQLRSSSQPRFLADALEPGVSFMSGFSAAALRQLMSTGAVPTSAPAWSQVLARLGQPRYDPVRAVVEAEGEVRAVAARLAGAGSGAGEGTGAGVGADASGGPEEDEDAAGGD